MLNLAHVRAVRSGRETTGAPLRIGVNALFLIPGGVGGTEIYTRALLAALARVDSSNRYFVYRNRETEAGIVPKASAFYDRPQPLNASSRPARIAYEQLLLPFALQRDKIDVILNCGITAPLVSTIPMVTIFYDLQYKRFGSHLPAVEHLATRLLFAASARRSARLVTMTRTTQLELIAYFPFAREKTLVVAHGLESGFQAVAARRMDEPRLERPFILAVSSLMAHKNFDTLLRAFVRLRDERPDLRLVVAGVRGRDTVRLETLRDSLGLGEAVAFLGWIPRADLLELFATAEVFVFPSRYEGFGIPVLEALTAEVPLACSDIPVLREIAGDAASYFDPEDAGDIARSVSALLDDAALRTRLIRAGKLRSREYDLDRNVVHLIDALGSVADKHVSSASSSR